MTRADLRQRGSSDSIRRDAWRIELFHEQITEEAAQRRRAAAMHVAVWIGVALGLVGSVSMYH